MELMLLGFLYAFGAACVVNYLIMFVRIRTTEMYVQRRKRVVDAYEKLYGPLGNGAVEEREGEDHAPETDASADLLSKEPLRVAFLHPDLGIGGAERLIIDAAVGLQKRQSIRLVELIIVTNHHDRSRAFEETTDGTVRIVVRGSALPASIFGRARVLCATIRMGFAAFATCWSFPNTDCFVVDQVAAAMPVLHFFAGRTPILFYSHFPDQLCDPNRNPDRTFKSAGSGLAPWHETYRGFFDQVEASSMKFATNIVCNSKFSRQVCIDTFPTLADKIHEVTDIFYPPVEMKVREVTEDTLSQSAALRELKQAVSGAVTFVSINRYERKKNIELAIEAFALLLSTGEFKGAEGKKPLMLIIAGGYDPRLAENVQYADELAALATTKLRIPASQVRYLKNISDDEKAVLLSEMRALVYTPSREHFGIVPVEAMAYSKPVVAIADGGPCESVGSVELEDPSKCGGLLSSPEPAAFAEKMARFARDPVYAAKVGAQGRARVLEKFSMEAFSMQLVTRLVRLRSEADKKLLAEGIELAKKEAASKAGKSSQKAKSD
ncbi:glycosyltransferase-like protein [Leishmania donovani]|uniref:Alpha-1,3/1,6-mannosyltransferase ALG2 n=1 Tax=Leishmania donovani TaxID=5661 RepID=A0A3Q8IEF0_LEIDO|nr:glycosyltransferase-like protein [Leishmania donovani]AYU82574.1 dolichyl-P-Man:GDP-Man1GlcNAc2-PP-dolichyl alpha-1,3-mannosyltransferase, putative [Leishmania donovani]TPP40124.1 Glycosyl transferases group 1 family protein [Leishmania donovani]CBZ37696.1 glycosyltransferase-like protein [Leishmania donovani]